MGKLSGQDRLFYVGIDSFLRRQISEDFEIEGRELLKTLGFDMPAADLPLIPNKEDFYYFPFRHLSATIVGGGTWKATDFSEDSVLEKSTKLIKHKPAYRNHELYVGNAIGYIGDPMWKKAYKNSKGDKVPGGIDAPFVIDGKIHPKLVREMSSPVSPVTSASVTTVFEWEASHEFEHEGDFYWHLGEDVDGTMVRRVVKEIIDYEESSLVWLGADPYAKMLDENGQVINIDRAGAFSKPRGTKIYTDFAGKKYYVFDCSDKERLIHLSKSTRKPNEFSSTPKFNKVMDELLAFLAEQLETTPEKIKEGKFSKADAQAAVMFVKKTDHAKLKKDSEDLAAATTKVTSLEAEVTTLKAADTTAKAQITELTKFKTDNEPMVKVGTSTLSAAKESAKKTYSLFAKGQPEATITKQIEDATDLVALDALVKMWGGKLVTEYGAVCKKCNSTEVEFRSSVPDVGNDPTKKAAASKADSHMASHFAN